MSSRDRTDQSASNVRVPGYAVHPTGCTMAVTSEELQPPPVTLLPARLVPPPHVAQVSTLALFRAAGEGSASHGYDPDGDPGKQLVDLGGHDRVPRSALEEFR